MSRSELNAMCIQAALASAATTVHALLVRHKTGAANARPGEILIEHADSGDGRNRTRIRYNGTFGVFEAVWFGDKALGGQNIHIAEGGGLADVVSRALGHSNALPYGVPIDPETRARLLEAERLSTDGTPY